MRQILVITHYPRQISIEVLDHYEAVVKVFIPYKSKKYNVISNYLFRRKFRTEWQLLDFPNSLYCKTKPRDFIFLEALKILPTRHEIWKKLIDIDSSSSTIISLLKPYVLSRSLGRKEKWNGY